MLIKQQNGVTKLYWCWNQMVQSDIVAARLNQALISPGHRSLTVNDILSKSADGKYLSIINVK